MSIRIWHQSFTVLGDLPAYAEAIAQHAKLVLRDDTQVQLHGQLPGTYPSNYPGDDIGHIYTYWIHGHQWVAAARAAERDGFDAYAMCTLPNPMLREARSLVDIPVVGLGETAFHFASMLGHRFGVMLFIDRMRPLYEEQIRNYGLESRCAGVRAAGLSFQDVLAGYADPEPAVAKFEAAAREFIAETGADVIVPGEVPLSLLLARHGVSKIDGATVIDTLGLCLKTAEMRVELERSTGLSASRSGWMNSAPERARIDQVLSFYGLDKIEF